MRHFARFFLIGCLVALPVAAQRGGGMRGGGFHGGGGFRAEVLQDQGSVEGSSDQASGAESNVTVQTLKIIPDALGVRIRDLVSEV